MIARLQKHLEAIESSMMKRENVVRFLIARFLLMAAMVIGFWAGIRRTL
jgi:hypothetical protein